MRRLKTLIHIHTDYSPDSNISPESLVAVAERQGIGCVAVTDHDTIDGALHVRDITDIQVIIGEEVTTRDGDMIGLFLHAPVRPGMSARDTAVAIREQGGLVFVPHPFLRMLGCGLGEKTHEIADLVDAVEVNNAQNLLSRPDRMADRLADQLGLPKYVGADSHMDSSIAPCFQTMRDFSGPADFLDALRDARRYPGRHPLHYFAESAAWMALRPFGLWASPRYPIGSKPINCLSQVQWA